MPKTLTICAEIQDGQVACWPRFPPRPCTHADVRAFIAGAGAREWAIRVDGDLAGVIRSDPEFGAWVTPRLHRRRVGLHAVVLALSRYFLADYAEVAAGHQGEN